jgi:Do/DeqQ family serine protease
MKKYILVSAITALVVSGVLLLSSQYFGWGAKTIKIEHQNQVPVQGAMFTVDSEGDIIPLDFTKTAEQVIDAVVHITSTQTMAVSQQGTPQNPFGDMFDDDIFRRFFGPDFRFDAPNQPRGPQARTGTGSGVIVSTDGYIVTNNHVIENADDIEVTMNDNRSFKAKLVGVDPTTDLALLQIEDKDLPTISFSDSDAVKLGEWVLAVGNPFNLTSTITAGIVSAKARNINILRNQYAIESFIQTDAAINPGNSGGALVNLNGQLIGINTAIASPTGSYSGYGFAIPSNIVKKVVEDLVEFGQVQRGFIGAVIRNVDQNLAKEKDLDIVKGVYIDSLVADGGAEKAGLKPGDVVVSIDGKAISTNSELLATIGGHRPGDKLRFGINRKGKSLEIPVELKNQDGTIERIKEEASFLKEKLGVDLETVSRKQSNDLQIEGGIKIKRIYPGKVKRETNIREGFIITHVNQKRVTSVDEMESLLKNKEGGVLLEGIYEEAPNDKYFYGMGM